MLLCGNGHPLEGQNLMMEPHPNGYPRRRCRICKYEANRGRSKTAAALRKRRGREAIYRASNSQIRTRIQGWRYSQNGMRARARRNFRLSRDTPLDILDTYVLILRLQDAANG